MKWLYSHFVVQQIFTGNDCLCIAWLLYFWQISVFHLAAFVSVIIFDEGRQNNSTRKTNLKALDLMVVDCWDKRPFGQPNESP